MIAYLSGKPIHHSSFLKKDNFVVIDVSGVGYKVFVLDKVLNSLKLGETLDLHIYTQVAETALDLYGFASREELDFFELLLTLSGIGPRSALDILKKAKLEDLNRAISGGDHATLAKVSGIGPKTAEKVVTGLKGKVGGLDSSVASVGGSDFSDALDALVALGYNPAQARDALEKVSAGDAGEKVREALKLLNKNK